MIVGIETKNVVKIFQKVNDYWDVVKSIEIMKPRNVSICGKHALIMINDEAHFYYKDSKDKWKQREIYPSGSFSFDFEGSCQLMIDKAMIVGIGTTTTQSQIFEISIPSDQEALKMEFEVAM